MVIHPSHIPLVNEIFSPSEDQISDAQQLLAAMEAAIERLKALPAAKGFDVVHFPGERGGHLERERRLNGVPLGTETVQALRAQAHALGLRFPEPVS